MITALKLLREASKLGWSFSVDGGGDDPDYVGASASKAWESVKDTDEARVSFFASDRSSIGWAYLMAPGPNTCADDETLVDYWARDKAFWKLWDLVTESEGKSGGGIVGSWGGVWGVE